MKMKNIVCSIILLTASFSGIANATPWSFTESVAAWALNPVTDGDGDMQFIFNGVSSDFLNATVTFSEFETGGALDQHDNYNVGFNLGFVYQGNGGYFSYTQIGLDASEVINNERLDSTTLANGAVVTKDVYALSGTQLAHLVSANGNSVGPVGFANQQSIHVVDTLYANHGAITDVNNSITTPVPEAEQWAMFLLGLPLIAAVVRRKQAALFAA